MHDSFIETSTTLKRKTPKSSIWCSATEGQLNAVLKSWLSALGSYESKQVVEHQQGTNFGYRQGW